MVSCLDTNGLGPLLTAFCSYAGGPQTQCLALPADASFQPPLTMERYDCYFIHWVFNFHVSSLVTLPFFFLLLHGELHLAAYRSIPSYASVPCCKDNKASRHSNPPNAAMVLPTLCLCIHFFSLVPDGEYATSSTYFSLLSQMANMPHPPDIFYLPPTLLS